MDPILYAKLFKEINEITTQIAESEFKKRQDRITKTLKEKLI
jgi:hypothetical protein